MKATQFFTSRPYGNCTLHGPENGYKNHVDGWLTSDLAQRRKAAHIRDQSHTKVGFRVNRVTHPTFMLSKQYFAFSPSQITSNS